MGAMGDFSFQPSTAPDTSLDSNVSMDQVFTGRVLQPVCTQVALCHESLVESPQCVVSNSMRGLQSTEQNKENGIKMDVNKMQNLSPQPVPTTPKLVKPIRMVETAKNSDDLPAMVDLVNWRNPPAAFCAMMCGALCCAGAHYVFGNTPLLSSAHLICTESSCRGVKCVQNCSVQCTRKSPCIS